MATPSTDYAPLSATQAKLAGQSGAVLERLARSHGSAHRDATIQVSVEVQNGDRAAVSLPEGTLELIASLLQEVSQGRRVRIVSTDAELTTQEAADMLNVSRPYLVKLLRQNQIPYRSVGSRRRILLNDLLAYKERASAVRLAGVDALVEESQRLGLY
jgi:excisionase family DNA binding protein